MAQSVLVKELRQIVGDANVLNTPVHLQLYQYDAYLEERRPDAVVFVHSTEEVAGIIKVCNAHGTPFVPRGGGTNLSGGTIPFKGGVVIEMIRMNQLLEVDQKSLRARVQPGMFNLELGNALAPLGYQFLPDPASQKAATLGGNVAENSGGPHCFKYGVTTNHVEGLTVVLPDGEIVPFEPAEAVMAKVLIANFALMVWLAATLLKLYGDVFPAYAPSTKMLSIW